MWAVLFLATALLASIPEFLCRVTIEPVVAVLEGKSLTIPCHYEPQYAGYVKYWCHGKTRDFCNTLARTDNSLSNNSKVNIFDDPAQEVVTVTMNDMKKGESGSYMCGVEIGGMWIRDETAFTYINVIDGMWVQHNTVRGEEGNSVTVECFYSERYRKSEKKWWRSGDWSSLQQTGEEGMFEDISLAIVDDRNEFFTVTLKKLQMKDTGWYWCGAGQEKKAIQIVVTPRLTTTPRLTSSAAFSATSSQPPEPEIQQRSISSCPNHVRSVFHPAWFLLAMCLSLTLMLGCALLMRKLWKLHMDESALRKGKAVLGPCHELSGGHGDMQKCVITIFSKDSEEICRS